MTKSRSRQTGANGRKAQRKSAITLRPEHQRELFALVLIGIAGMTIIFYLTGSTGTLGAGWTQMMEVGLGWGALIVPLVIGMLGIALFQSGHRNQTPLQPTQIIGTVLVMIAMLVILEFGITPRQSFADQIGSGGGSVGYVMLTLLSNAIGRPATFALSSLIGLAGIMLAFDITLVQILASVRHAFIVLWLTIRGDQSRVQPKRMPKQQSFVEDTGTSEAIITPIAERRTKAQYREEQTTAPAAPATTKAVAKPKVAKESTKARKAEKAQAEAEHMELLDNMLQGNQPRPPVPINTKPVSSGQAVQTALDGFEGGTAYRAWPMPPTDFLRYSIEATISDEEHRTKSRLIEETLASFKVEARVVNINVGPAVTQYELQPAVGVKVNKITTLDKDLALALAAPSIRIEAPIPGKSVVGIEIPNSSISSVAMRDIIESDDFTRSKAKLKLPLGKDVSGSSVVAGMERMPHLLVAGSTGSGKSVAINTFICALLMRHTPDDLKFIMVDPKRVELVGYNGIPHLLSPVVTEVERVVPTLKWAVREMERRYKLFAKVGVRNLDSYRGMAREQTDLETMPYIVIIIDELADLMMMAPDDVETLICRLAQMARATGIHLIIATQRPSVDVVTGLIKANFPSRMAFAVTSQIDSRVILDQPGAEQLLGRGDMLFTAADSPRTIRVQGTYLTDDEVEKIVRFWRTAQPPDEPNDESKPADKPRASTSMPVTTTATDTELNPELAKVERLPVYPREPVPHADEPMRSPADDADDDVDSMQPIAEYLSRNEQDTLLPEAIRLVQQHKRASASLLQRRLRIGYSKASQLIDMLEQQGIVGPADEGRSREVLIGDQRRPE
ncbi:MAG: DNA translocase FtsK [Roseiflexaceae bacterium]